MVRRLVVDRPDGLKEIFGLENDQSMCPGGQLVPINFNIYPGTYFPTKVEKHFILYSLALEIKVDKSQEPEGAGL